MLVFGKNRRLDNLWTVKFAGPCQHSIGAKHATEDELSSFASLGSRETVVNIVVTRDRPGNDTT